MCAQSRPTSCMRWACETPQMCEWRCRALPNSRATAPARYARGRLDTTLGTVRNPSLLEDDLNAAILLTSIGIVRAVRLFVRSNRFLRAKPLDGKFRVAQTFLFR